MKPNVLVYTFRTFPYLEQLRFQFSQVQIFCKLKADLESFEKTVLDKKPDYIIGFAKSHSERSWFEPLAINRFNKDKQVIKGAPEHYRLFVPSRLKTPFFESLQPSTSFCNYSMFKVSHFLSRNGIDIPFSFIHIGETGIGQVRTVLNL